jgi:hypothetical protein
MNTFVKSMLGMNFLISGSYIQFIMLELSYSLGVLICLLLVYRTRLLKYVIPKANLLGDDAVHTACFTSLTGYTATSLSPILFTG